MSDESSQLVLLGRSVGPEVVQHFAQSPYFCASRVTAIKILRDVLAVSQEFKLLLRVTTWGETSQKKLVIFGILPVQFGSGKKATPTPPATTTTPASSPTQQQQQQQANSSSSPSSVELTPQQQLMARAAERMANSTVAQLSAAAAASLLAPPTQLQLGVPIQLWLGINYPVEAPQCYIVPSPEAGETLVANHPIIDRGGLCYAPLLASWNPQDSTLLPLLKQFQRIFGVIPPIWVDDREPPSEDSNQGGSSPSSSTGGRNRGMSVSNSSFGGGNSSSSFAGADTDDNNLCVICLCEERDTVLIPCGHMNCCSACAAVVNTCPICRSAVRLRQRVFT